MSKTASKKITRWSIIITPERSAIIKCPVCNYVENYNIVKLPSICPKCKTVFSEEVK